mmetsp:Transcript_15527/g.41777  ORF Transcript_15527/g.41777 Transcript_15527/m.41777 type:complete len:107 (-) Transcript_15527:31-351(-)
MCAKAIAHTVPCTSAALRYYRQYFMARWSARKSGGAEDDGRCELGGAFVMDSDRLVGEVQRAILDEIVKIVESPKAAFVVPRKEEALSELTECHWLRLFEEECVLY